MAWKVLELNYDDTLKQSLQKIAAARFQEIYSYEQRVLNSDNVEALHDMRVSARRLLSVFEVFRDYFPKKKLKKQSDKLKKLINALGNVREHDVFVTSLMDATSHFPEADTKAIQLLIAREKNARRVQQRNLAYELKKLRMNAFEKKFSRLLHDM